MNYLLFLQDLRETLPSFVTYIFVVISEASIYLSICVSVVIYLAIDKKVGSRFFFNLFGAKAFSDLLKMTFCINRPWVREPRLHVAKEIESTATGYSFPSGHTTFATAFYGTFANWLRKKGVVIACLVLIVLTAFARNYVGAHTIWDVLFAIVFTIVIMVITSKVERWLEADPSRDLVIMIACLVITVVALAYVYLRPYEVTVLADGSLLVDPVHMSADAFEAFGLLAGWSIGWFVERRFINFSTEGTKLRKIMRSTIGIIMFILLYKIILKQLLGSLDIRVYKFLRYFIAILWTFIVYPWMIKVIQKRTTAKS